MIKINLYLPPIFTKIPKTKNYLKVAEEGRIIVN